MTRIFTVPKTCSVCGIEKTEKDFYRNKNMPGGRENSCKACNRERRYGSITSSGGPLSPEDRHKVCMAVLGQEGCGFKSRGEVLAIRRRVGDAPKTRDV